MRIHTGRGNRFDKISIDYDEAFKCLEQLSPCVGSRGKNVRQSAAKNKFRLRLHSFLQSKKFFEPLTQSGLRKSWFDEFVDFWSNFLGGRPLTVMDFHLLRFHYRLQFQEVSKLDWSSNRQHAENWKREKNIYLLFGNIYSNALNPWRNLSALNPSAHNRVLEYGCSLAPYYRAWKTYFSHIDVSWTLADLKNIPYMFSRYSYRDDAAVEQFVVIDECNMDNPLDNVEGEYDAIILTTVLEHVHNPTNVLRMLTGRLKPGGRLVFDYIKSDAAGLDSVQGLLMRKEALEYIRQTYEIVSGDMSDLDASVDLCIGIKKTD